MAFVLSFAGPVLATLLGHITQWSPTGSIDYVF